MLLSLPLIAILGLGELCINQFLREPDFYKVDSSKQILILGNSHSECALNDSLIDHSLNLSQANDGYFYIYYKLKNIISSNPSFHTVVLEYTNINFPEDMDKWIYLEEYVGAKYPKYSHLFSTQDQAFLFSKDPGAFLVACKDAIIAKYKLLQKNEINVPRDFDWGKYYFLVRDKIPQIKEERKKAVPLKSTTKKISSLNILYLRRIVDYCKESHIRLILFRSPLHSLFIKEFETELQGLLITEWKGIPFWDYSDFPFEDYEFGDLEHLNHIGAKRLSPIINQRMKTEGISSLVLPSSNN